MGLRAEARDPWTYILGGLAGGVAWAVGVPALGVLVVAGAVAGTRAVVAAVLGPPALPGPMPPPPLPTTSDTPEADWLFRADRAVDSFNRLANSIPDQILSERTRSMGDQAKQTLEGLRRLSGQASTTRGMAAELDAGRLGAEAQELERRRDKETDPDVRNELTRSLESLHDQSGIARRLARSLSQILARIESGTLGLERLVAQLAEILALADASTQAAGADQLESLADELEGLRSGLAETERLSRRALSASSPGGSVQAPELPADDQKG
jgi:hypothetical protein